jgi:hypothetical protein
MRAFGARRRAASAELRTFVRAALGKNSSAELLRKIPNLSPMVIPATPHLQTQPSE